MKKVSLSILCLGVIFLGVMTGFFWSVSYIGKETFRTQQEYTDFKEAVSNPEINIVNMQSLSSEPPIVVSFDVEVPPKVVFAYGVKDKAQLPAGCFLSIVGFAALWWVLFIDPKQISNLDEEKSE